MGTFIKLQKQRLWRRVRLRSSEQAIAAIVRIWAPLTLVTLPLAVMGVYAFPEITLWRGILIIAVCLLIFLFGQVFIAWREVKREDELNGQWVQGKYLYHEPKHVLTKEVTPQDDKQAFRFSVDAAEPDSFVQFYIEHHGGLAQGYIISPYSAQVYGWGCARRNPQFSAKINKDREAILVASVPSKSVPTVIRVSMLSWEWRLDDEAQLSEPEGKNYEFFSEPPPELIDTLAKVKPNQGFVEITRHDKASFSIAEHIDNAFVQAGWNSDFKKGIGHQDSPYSKFGIEVIGADPDLVNAIVGALNQNGLTGVKPNIPKDKRPVNAVIVRVGVGD